ncbi:MAG: hypothetical protein AB1665_05300 [Candidatus Thermoplasmatota archaeon]
MAEDEVQPVVLTKGSKYRIKSLESKDAPLVSHGTFMGYTLIGHDEGVCMLLDESHKEYSGRYRIIPVHMIISIDVIKAAEQKEAKDSDATAMFG